MTQIRIAEKDPRKRGELFKRMIGQLLEKQGYSVTFNRVKQPGYELDFDAKHGNYKIIGECKAHKGKIDSPDLLKFFGKFELEKRINPHLSAEFYSLSPLTGRDGAERLLEHIKEEDGILFSVHTPEEIIGKLKSGNMLSGDIDQIEDEFKTQIEGIAYATGQKFYIDDIFLEYFRGEYYWICLISEHAGRKSFLLLDSDGNIPEGSRSLSEIMKEHDESLNDLAYLPQQEDLDLDSKKLLSIVACIDENESHWWGIFDICINILIENGYYNIVRDIFKKIEKLNCSEEIIFGKAEDIGDRIWFSDSDDNNSAHALYEFAKNGYDKLNNQEKVRSIFTKVSSIEEDERKEIEEKRRAIEAEMEDERRAREDTDDAMNE